jgi:hypothetical protein
MRYNVRQEVWFDSDKNIIFGEELAPQACRGVTGIEFGCKKDPKGFIYL